MVPTFIRRRRFAPGMLVRRICDFEIAAISVSDQNRASGSISSCTTRINQPVRCDTSDTRLVSICYGITEEGKLQIKTPYGTLGVRG